MTAASPDSPKTETANIKPTQAPTNPLGTLPRFLAAAIQPLERESYSRATLSTRPGGKCRVDAGQVSNKTMQLRRGQSTISSFCSSCEQTHIL